ncbi:hypothetical protein CDAR_14401 [Caerostris darwini]|uniref:Uncharacterized protein n=1 Tax=Caerostris darwini TaxID=1538125 RepID=A0AAV4QFH7_9ARAC|nr:hypothetical protein CDAR_14401 [Caerostris darwini]
MEQQDRVSDSEQQFLSISADGPGFSDKTSEAGKTSCIFTLKQYAFSLFLFILRKKGTRVLGGKTQSPIINIKISYYASYAFCGTRAR